jgi:hypothetical protein
MNKIANEFKMQLIRNSAIPLHERKAKAAQEKEPPSFEKMLKNAVISHVTGVDASQEVKETTTASPVEETETVEMKATAKVADSSLPLNTSLKWYDHTELGNLCPIENEAEYNRYMDDFRAEKRARIDGMAGIVLRPGELLKFMEELQKVAESGGCLTEFLQKFLPEPVERFSLNPHDVKLGTQGSDVIWLNPETGEIVHAQHNPPSELGLLLSGLRPSTMNREAQNDFVWDLAYDLQQFIQNLFFKQEDECADEIDRLLEELKLRQEGKCMRRFEFVAAERISLNISVQQNIKVMSYHESQAFYSHFFHMSG